MRRSRRLRSEPDAALVAAALDAMDAGSLRELIRASLPWLDDQSRARLTGEIIDRAARTPNSDWAPESPSNDAVVEIAQFAKAALHAGYADPSEVDAFLQQGIHAFLAKNYQTAAQVYQDLVIPISEAEIDLGQHEMLDEVLSVDVTECAAQYVASVYMISTRSERASAVKTAIEDMSAAGYFTRPLHQLERVAIEPLPDFDEFLKSWDDLVSDLAHMQPTSEWDTDIDHWRREVAQRLYGTDGLASIARSTKRASDFRAWCGALVEARDWKAALTAFDEAATSTSATPFVIAGFLDGAALAAQALGRSDLPNRLERSWRASPSLLRLCRWLGNANSRAVLTRRVTASAAACPPDAHRQLAFLRVLEGDLGAAATYLAAAPGLGWSDREHPGHLIFPIFCRLLGEAALSHEVRRFGLDEDYRYDETFARDGSITDEEVEAPRLKNPTATDVLSMTPVTPVKDESVRAAMLKSMRAAAEKRLDGVTKNKRRNWYEHAALLATACAAVDTCEVSHGWLADIRKNTAATLHCSAGSTSWTGGAPGPAGPRETAEYTKMPLYEMTSDRMVPIEGTTFPAANVRERYDLQRMLREQIEIVVPGGMVLAEEFASWVGSRRSIDLLVVDKDANLEMAEGRIEEIASKILRELSPGRPAVP